MTEIALNAAANHGDPRLAKPLAARRTRRAKRPLWMKALHFAFRNS